MFESAYWPAVMGGFPRVPSFENLISGLDDIPWLISEENGFRFIGCFGS
jgi:hypothetical protein